MKRVSGAGASGDNVSPCHLVGAFTYSLRIGNTSTAAAGEDFSARSSRNAGFGTIQC